MLDVAEPMEWLQTLSATVTGACDYDDTTRIDLIRTLEQVKCAAEALQADLSADFDTSQRADQAARGVPTERQGRGIAGQVALARRESRHQGETHLGLAKILRTELPHTHAAFRAGRISQWRATLIARETACLTLADRLVVDQRIAADPDRLERLGDRELVGECRDHAYELDPAGVVARRRKAERDRHVSLRPAPDVMSSLNALLPVKDGVSVYACLKQTADTLISGGDERSRGQIMADTLVDRVTGRVPVNGTTATPAPQVVINAVVDAEALVGDSHAGGHLDGYGPIPGDLAREWATGINAALRRLFAHPDTGDLVAMESRARLFPAALAALIRFRDRFCRTPWCDAPIRHTDHSWDHADGGPTDAHNGQGLCEACSHDKQAPGWRARPAPGERHTVITTTPTGHTYTSTAPRTGRHRHCKCRTTVLEIYRPMPDLTIDLAA